METVEVDGLQIAYERAGSGPALVLLHGYVGDGPTTWRRQLDGLSDEFTVVAWDAPGAGGSSDPPEQFGLDGYADCLAGFLDRLGLHTVCLAGLSFGGILALALQRRHSAKSSALFWPRRMRAGPVRCPQRSPTSAYVRRSPWPTGLHRRS